MKKTKVDTLYEFVDLIKQDVTGIKLDPVIHILLPLIMLYLSYITIKYSFEELKSRREKEE